MITEQLPPIHVTALAERVTPGGVSWTASMDEHARC